MSTNPMKSIVFSLRDGSFVDWNLLMSTESFTKLNSQKLMAAIDDSGDEDEEPSTYRIRGPSINIQYEDFCLIIAAYFLKRLTDEEPTSSREERFRIFINHIGEKIGKTWNVSKWNAVIEDIIKLGYLNRRCPKTNNLINIRGALVH